MNLARLSYHCRLASFIFLSSFCVCCGNNTETFSWLRLTKLLPENNRVILKSRTSSCGMVKRRQGHSGTEKRRSLSMWLFGYIRLCGLSVKLELPHKERQPELTRFARSRNFSEWICRSIEFCLGNHIWLFLLSLFSWSVDLKLAQNTTQTLKLSNTTSERCCSV